MKDFNLSEWVLTHRAFTGFLMVLVLLGACFAYSGWDSGKTRRLRFG